LTPTGEVTLGFRSPEKEDGVTEGIGGGGDGYSQEVAARASNSPLSGARPTAMVMGVFSEKCILLLRFRALFSIYPSRRADVWKNCEKSLLFLTYTILEKIANVFQVDLKKI